MNQKYNLVDSLEKLKQLDALLMDGDKPRYQLLGYDTETNGLALHRTTIVGFSISFDSKSGYYVPILKWVPDESSKKDRSVDKVVYAACMEGKLQCVWTGATFDEFVLPKDYDAKKRIPFIINYLERWLTKTNLLMHNASFDVNQTFINFGVELKNNLFVDTSLLLHVLNENERTGLKAAAERYKVQLGINPHAMAAIEKKEMDSGIIENGGKPGMVWRAPLHTQYKYACSDTFLMYGIYEVAIREFQEKFGEKGLTWFFKDEVMPVCKEVVIDMKRRGVYIDVPHFKRLFEQNQVKMRSLEDQFIQSITPYLNDFPLSKPLEEAVSEQRLIKKIVELEGLKIPTVTNPKTGEQKESLAKAAVHKQFVQNPHWIWGYILGEDEIRYSEDKLNKIRQELFEESEGRRYRFNLGSRDHLIWLFCTKLGFNKTKLPQTDSATKTNPIPKMDADVLTEFMLPKYPWVATLLTYKKLQKLQSTYIEPALELNVDGWLYMDMKQNGTTSGRFSCSGGYNLQTLPRVDDENEVLDSCDKCHSSNVEVLQELECIADRKCSDCGFILKDVTRPSAIKKGFIAPPGYKIVNADYSSLEPKCFAYVSGENLLKQVYWDNLDLYSKVYCDIFDKERQYSADPKAPNFLKKVAKAKRTWIKPIVLGIPYGAEAGQVANLIGARTQKRTFKGELVLDEEGNPIMQNDFNEGRRVLEAYLGTYKKLRQYMRDQELKAVSLGYVETLLGRRRHLPFARKINEILGAHGIDWSDIAHGPVNELKKGENVSFRSPNNGNQVVLTKAMFDMIRESIGFKKETAQEKGYWAYVRNLLKSDLNNAKNNPIQGLAGHILNRGTLDTNRKFREAKLDALICLTVHDEVTAYAKNEHAKKASDLMKDGMENNRVAKMLDVAMEADPIICDNLKDSK